MFGAISKLKLYNVTKYGFKFQFASISCISRHTNYDIKRNLLSNNTNTVAQSISNKSPEIVIVGAGLAGLSAAHHLIENGFTNIQILEASNRYGGRIYTKQFGGSMCELGAKWIYKNHLSNSLYDLIGNDILDDNLNDNFIDIQNKYFVTSNGEKINRDIIKQVDDIFSNILKRTADIKDRAQINVQNNSKTYLENESEKIAKNLFKKNSWEASKVFIALINDFSSFFGCDLSKVHISHLFKISPFYKNLLITKSGMISIMKPLIDKIDSKKILYGKPIGQIKWSITKPFKKVLVTSLDGTSYTADHVICTVPLGVLKKFSSYLFDPQLTREKISAISRLDVSTPGQYYLHYKKGIDKWFTVNNIKPVWSSTEISNKLELSRNITEISLLPNSNSVVEVKRLGNEEFERFADKKIIMDITKLLRSLLKNNEIPYADDIIKSTWGTDTKFLGGFPFLMRPNSEKFIKHLSKPCGPVIGNTLNRIPKLQFAGDATDWKGFGTLHGARRSGIREAKRIIRFYNSYF